MNRINGKVAGGGVLLLLLLFLVGGVVDHIANPPTASAKDGSSDTKCASNVHYYAYDAPTGSNRFGPELTAHTVDAAQKRLAQKVCSDPLFAAVTEASLNGTLKSQPAAAIEKRAKQFAAHPDVWRTAVKSMKGNIDSYRVFYDPHQYETALMVPGGNHSAMPSLAKTAVDVPAKWVLEVTMKDGSKHLFRFICDLQPVGHLPHFPTPQCMSHCGPTPVCQVHCNPTCQVNCQPHRCDSPYIWYVNRCVKPAGQHDQNNSGGDNNIPAHQPVGQHPQGSTDGAPDSPPPPPTRPPGDNDGGSGDGGAAPPTGPTDDGDAGQTTGPTPPPEQCPPGATDC